MTVDEFKKYEKAAKLELSDKERELFLARANTCLELFEALSGINTDNAEPLISVSPLTNVMREDVVKQPFTREELQKHAPEVSDG